MSEFLIKAFAISPHHLGAGWFWFLPLSFLVHDGEEALPIWRKGSLKNALSSAALTPPQAMVAMLYEFVIVLGVTLWAMRPQASAAAIFSYAVMLGLWTGHGFLHLRSAYQAGRHYSMGIVTIVPFVLLGGLYIYSLLLRTHQLGWGGAVASFVIGAILILPFIRSARRVGLAFPI